MSENSPKKIKVFKKKPQNAPVSPAVETPEEDIVLPAETKSYDDQVAEDDEFERLLNQFISSELEDVDTGLEEKTEEPPAPAPAAAPAGAVRCRRTPGTPPCRTLTRAAIRRSTCSPGH